MNTPKIEDAIKVAQDTSAKFQETVLNTMKQAQPELDKLQKTFNSSVKQIEPHIKKAQEDWNEQVAKVSPELAKAQKDLQAQAQDAFKNLQDNFTKLQASAFQNPFNPFELQKIVMTQHIEFVKSFNRQFEGQLESIYSQLNTASEKINPKK